MKSLPEGPPTVGAAVNPLDAGSPRHRRSHSGWQTSGVIAGVLVLVIAALGGFLYDRLNHNIIGVNIDNALGNDRPTISAADKRGHTPVNILVLGSDSRAGIAGYGVNDHPPLSDTGLLVHVSAGRERALVMSIPRDTLVARPPCATPPGGTDPGGPGVMFNTALAVGGPACAVKTVEQLTGVRIDHFMEVDFSGFKNMINAVGGVNVCLAKPVNDPIHAHLVLAAGRHEVSGEQALAFVRERYGVGDGSDLGRIKLQQQFIGSLITKMQSTGVLLNPARLYSLANAATKSVTTDSALATLASLISFAEDMRRVPSAGVTFVTMPTAVAPSDRNRLVPLQPLAGQLFTVIRTDRSTLSVASLPVARPPAPGDLRPSQVQLTVLNGTRQTGAGATAAAALRGVGFPIGSVGNAPSHTHPVTVVEYSAGQQAAAKLVAAALPGSVPQLVAGRPMVTVVVGAGYRGVTAPVLASPTPAPPASKPLNVPTRRATQDICSAS